MASTHTNTKTVTYARLPAICNQFRTAFYRIMNYSEDDAAPYLKWLSQKKIVSIAFWGYQYNQLNQKEKWCELTLHVDWVKHNEFVLKGSDHIQLKENYKGMIPEINAAIYWMQQMVECYNLYTSFTLTYGNITSEEHDEFAREQDLVPSKKIEWHSTPISQGIVSGPELSELTADMKFCE